MASGVQLLVEIIKQDIAEQGTQGRPLGRAFLALSDETTHHHPRLQVAADQTKQTLIGNPLCQPGHQDIVVDLVEELLQVDVDQDVVALFDVVMGLLNRLPGIPARSEAVA